MKLNRLFVTLPFLLNCTFVLPTFAQENSCDRTCLSGVLDSYLQAVITHNPAAAPLATIYRHTENSVVQPLGEGMWKSATGLGAMQRKYLDEVTGNAVYYGTLVESDIRAVVSLRIKVDNQKISEAEWFIGRENDAGVDGVAGTVLWDADYLTTGNPPQNRVVPVAQRSSREELIYITNSYWDGIVNRNPNIERAHPGCFREENGQKTTGNPLPPERVNDGGLNGLSDCRSGTSTFNVLNVAARRWAVVDVEAQVVVASAVFIREPGHPKRRNHFSDVFEIDGGLLRGIYTAMYYVEPTRAVPNWPPFDGNFPLAQSFGTTK